MTVAGYAFVYWSSTRLPSCIVAILVSTSFLWIYFGECFVLRSERVRPGVFVPVLIGHAGIPFLSGTGIHEGRFISLAAAVGVLASGFAWPAGALAHKRRQLPECHFQTAGLQLGFAGILLAAISCELGEWHRLAAANLASEAMPMLGMAYLVLGGSVPGFGAFLWLMQRESPSLVATFAYVNPIVAMMVGIGFAHEHCSLKQLIVAAAIIASVVSVWRFKSSAPSAKVRPAQRITPPLSDPLFVPDPESVL
jgi:drug/metabolite transporter (DMT)-like permease